MTFEFAELAAKSCFSFLKGASHPEEMIEQAQSLGYKALALTDENGFYGMVRAYKKAEDLKFKAIYGVEIQIENSALLLLAKNFAGYKSICRLLSEGFKDQPKGKPLFTRKLLEEWIDPQNLKVLLPPRDFPSQDLFSFLRESFKPSQLVTRSFHPDRDQPLKKWISEEAKDLTKVWTFDPFFHQQNRFELFEVLRAIRNITPLSKLLPSPNAEHYLKPLSFFENHSIPAKWLRCGIQIAEECEFSPKEIRYRYPREWVPEGKTSMEFLKELCEAGLKTRYVEGAPLNVLAQLKEELCIVHDLEFEDYFLTVWDIVRFARSQKILCQGRGSAANSIICYLLEVTSIDPVQMNLLFGRFISRERNEAPDIDIDFEHERREEVIQYLYQKYGRHRAGMVATLITYRTKSALRDIGKALEVPVETIDLMSHRASWRERVLAPENQPPEHWRWFKLARVLKGFPRHLGQHTGGLILTADRLDEISPIEPASMQNRSVVQWDKYDIEKLGLLKVDCLSLGMLTCLRKAFELIRVHENQNLELHTIPADDPKTYEMIQQGRTVGVFQIESRAQMTMLPRLKPRNFYDLVVEVAIVRPGPLQGGMVHPYLRRRLGLEKVTYEHPKLRPILEKTLGVPIFQEQVMKMAIDVAGYTAGEADELRRAMGAWKRTGNLEKHAAEMKKRLVQNGVPEDFSIRICNQILGFGEYGFPESHAASFALLTYASAYLKAHHPAAFLCSLLNSMPMGFYPLHLLTSSFQREGLEILPVHTECSQIDHTLEKNSESLALRLGLRCIRGLQKDHMQEFIQKRTRGEFDLYIFNRDERAALAMACERDQRREAYWKALNPHQNTLELSQDSSAHFKNLNDLEHMFLDFEFTDTSLKSHPALLLKKHRWNYSLPLSALRLSQDLSKEKTSQRVRVFGMVQIIQSPPTAKGMFFITLEDETGFLNLVVKPPVYEKFKMIIQNQMALLVEGRIQNQSGYISILVEKVHTPIHSGQIQIIQKNQKTAGVESSPLPIRKFY
ncbi:MAG: error-prone DNA polymerase [Deltaproteobacteria bacterium]|nr:error-prone DNA polymerase [Deltaproteobacteria bacterium]